MKLSALVLLSLTTVCAVSFQSSSLNSDILEQLANRQIVEFGRILIICSHVKPKFADSQNSTIFTKKTTEVSMPLQEQIHKHRPEVEIESK